MPDSTVPSNHRAPLHSSAFRYPGFEISLKVVVHRGVRRSTSNGWNTRNIFISKEANFGKKINTRLFCLGLFVFPSPPPPPLNTTKLPTTPEKSLTLPLKNIYSRHEENEVLGLVRHRAAKFPSCNTMPSETVYLLKFLQQRSPGTQY